MNGEQLAEHVRQHAKRHLALSKTDHSILDAATDRVLGIGQEQYVETDAQGRPVQRFERMSVVELLRYVEEEYLDLINYAGMLAYKTTQPHTLSHADETAASRIAGKSVIAAFAALRDIRDAVELVEQHRRDRDPVLRLSSDAVAGSSTVAPLMLALVEQLAHKHREHLSRYAIDDGRDVVLDRIWAEITGIATPMRDRFVRISEHATTEYLLDDDQLAAIRWFVGSLDLWIYRSVNPIGSIFREPAYVMETLTQRDHDDFVAAHRRGFEPVAADE